MTHDTREVQGCY